MGKLFLALFLLLSTNLFAKTKVIAKIPEASGIVYSHVSNTLFVVNDEGTIYEITKDGHILREKKLGDYDLEGISTDKHNNYLYLAVEGNDSVLVLNKATLEIQTEIPFKRKYKDVEVLRKGDNGLEAIAYIDGKIYAANQSNKRYPKSDSSVIVISDFDLYESKLKIKSIIPLKIKDVSGLTFHKGFLYILSDKKNRILKYDLDEEKVVKKIKLSKKHAQEGITFDNNGIMYIADDNGSVLKIK